jgi:hypothetical protein
MVQASKMILHIRRKMGLYILVDATSHSCSITFLLSFLSLSKVEGPFSEQWCDDGEQKMQALFPATEYSYSS